MFKFSSFIYILLTTLFYFVTFIVSGQKTINDSAFIVRENRNGVYHAIFVETDKHSKFYDQILDTGFTANIAPEYRRLNDLKTKKISLPHIPKRWVVLKQYKGRYFTYKPCDFYGHYLVDISDSVITEFSGEGSELYKIDSLVKSNAKSFKFNLKGEYADKELTIHFIDRKRGIAVFEDHSINYRRVFHLMIDSDKIRTLPIIVNLCETEKRRELAFDKIDYKKLIMDK